MKANETKIRAAVAVKIAEKYYSNIHATMGEIWEDQDKLIAEVTAKPEQEQTDYINEAMQVLARLKANRRLWDMANMLAASKRE